MKRRILALLLSVVLLLPFCTLPSAADEKLTFISINDTLPPELLGCAAAYGGSTYVPYYVFTNYGFGISYSYDSDSTTAHFYSGDKHLYYVLSSGETYDDDNYKYSVCGITRSGTVYVPLNFTARFFGGISYSNIAGNEYGSILRITDGTEVLTDAEFLRAAKSVMRTYAASYQGSGGGLQSPDETEEDIHEGEQIDLSFIGLPVSGVLERLSQNKTAACFFLTAEDVRSAPDMVRRLVCGGHSVGVYCVSDLASEYEEVSDLLFDAARVCTELVTAAPDYAEACREQTGMAGLVYCDFDLYTTEGSIYAVTAKLEIGSEGASLQLGSGTESVASLGVLLNYLQEGKFNAGAPREVG